jgi:hypothetical protein
MSQKKLLDRPKELLYLCDSNSTFQEIPSWFQGDWNHIRCSEQIEHNPDIHCSLEDLHLLHEQKYDAIWLPQGLNTFSDKQLNRFLIQVNRLLRMEGCFWFKTTNIKELARLAYQTGWNDPIQGIGLSPKELLYGNAQQQSTPNCRALIKNGFTLKDLAETLQKAKFAKVEIVDQGLTFLVRAYRLPITTEQKCQLVVQEYDINQRIATRDKLDQNPQLPISYSLEP